MTKGIAKAITEETRSAIVRDYQGGMGINTLRTKYNIGQQRVTAILDAAGVKRLPAPRVSVAPQSQWRKTLVEQSAGLGRTPTRTEWCYIAGLFDGEGYLGTASRGGNFRLAIAQLRESGLHEWLVETLGAGRIATSLGKNAPMGYFHLEAQRHIYEFCSGVAPFIMVKRRQISTALIAYHDRYQWPLPPFYLTNDPIFLGREMIVPSDSDF